MPYFGLFSFLQYGVQVVPVTEFCFNALLRAFLFSTTGEILTADAKRNRFNALLRAFLFSTVKDEMEYLKLKCFNALLRAFLFSTLKKYMI